MRRLKNAVKAGWSGNDPLSSLGLFGMGFNIATARLGRVAEVWTSRAGDPEDVGVRIDLDELRASRNFRVPRRTRAKANHNEHGTEIVISRLKPHQRAYLARSNNRTTIRKHLARTYSALLVESDAGRIRLTLNGTRIAPQRHCLWDASRSVELPDGSTVDPVELIDAPLAPRRYCTHCMRTLAAVEETCPTASPSCNVEETPRRIKGWVGVQRYLHNTEFGIDFIRNGRKIEIGNKDWGEQSLATRGCVFTAHGARDDLRQGGSSGCPGLWPGGDLALNTAFQNDVAVACPHRRTTTRCRAIHFLITTQAKRNLSSRSGIGGVLSAT